MRNRLSTEPKYSQLKGTCRHLWERWSANSSPRTSQSNCLPNIQQLPSVSQVHAVLRSIADESVLSSFHMMKSLLMKVNEGIPLDRRPSLNIPRRSATPGPGYESSSGGESTSTNSGAIDTNEDLYNIETGSEGCPPNISASKTLDMNASDLDPARARTPNSGSSYSNGDNCPLAFLSQAQSPVTAKSSINEEKCSANLVRSWRTLTLKATSRQEPSSPGHLILYTIATNFTARYVKQTYLFIPEGHGRYFATIKLRNIYGGIKGGGRGTSSVK